jgi:hypothetical protein
LKILWGLARKDVKINVIGKGQSVISYLTTNIMNCNLSRRIMQLFCVPQQPCTKNVKNRMHERFLEALGL